MESEPFRPEVISDITARCRRFVDEIGLSGSGTTDLFAQLVREAEGLGIIWANGRESNIDTLCTEAIEWTIRAIKAVAFEVGHIKDLQVRSISELPLQGDITDQDFDVPLAHVKHGDRLSLIRERHYAVKTWLRDFVQSS